jgi:two-component sensor histidine kinase
MKKYLYYSISILLLFCFERSWGQTKDGDMLFTPIQDSIKKYLYLEIDRSEEFAALYLENAKNGGDKFYLAKGYNFTGMVSYIKGEALLAVENYLTSLKLFEELREDWYVAVVLNNIGAAYVLRKKTDQTIKYYEEALEKFKDLKDTAWIANVSNNLAIQYIDLQQFEKGLEIQLEVLQIFESSKDEESALLIKGNIANTYYQLGNINKAKEMARSYLAHPLAENDLTQKINVLSTLARAEWKLNNYSSAKLIIQQAIQLAKSEGRKNELSNALYHQTQILESAGEYKAALHSFREYHQMYDTLLNAEKDAKLVELLTQYEVDKKENTITLLNQEKVIAQRNLYILAVGALGLFVLMLLAIYFYNKRQKYVSLLEQKNQTITVMLEEKEFLIKEIHHRVKNNLQIVSSLLQLQSRYIIEPNAIEALHDGDNRVKSMAIIHHHLYSSDNVTAVNIKNYTDNLLENLSATYSTLDKEIEMKLDIDPIFLDVSLMIPLGLIINEIITNAFKYAFTNRSNGAITVTIKEHEDELIVRIQDDGVGKEIVQNQVGFGTRMINAFLKKLNASMETNINNGTAIRISIPQYKSWQSIKKQIK